MSEPTYREEISQAVPIGTAAYMLGVTVETIRRWEAEGKISGTRTPGGQRRFERAEIERVRQGRAS